MDTRSPGPSGLLGSLRGFADGVIGSAHDRIELLAVELQEEKHRLVQVLLWVCAIVFLAVLAVVFLSLVLLVLFWETARVAVVSGLALTYTGALIVAVATFRRFLRRQPVPFAGTLAELKEDRECLRRES